MSWYLAYLHLVALLWVFSAPSDRNALRILLIAGVGSFLLARATHSIIAPWKLVLPASVESLTILALLRWSRNRMGYTQIALLVCAWITHVLCYTDLITGSNLVYDNYEAILGAVAIGQLLACYDTVYHNWLLVRGAFLRWNRPDSVCASGCDAGVLHSEGGSRL